MKTLTEMKKVCCFNRLIMLAVALSLVTTFTACSSDDDGDNIPVYSLKDVEGTYSGKMFTESAPVVNPHDDTEEGDKPVGTEVSIEVKDNQIVINKLPVDDFIKTIITNPDQAATIIQAIGDINYKIPYTPAFDENKSNILLELKPEPLEIKFTLPTPEPQATEEETNEVIIKVTIEADQKGNFAYDGKLLKFAIKATKVEIGDTSFDEFPVTTFSFDITKK